MNIGEQRQTIYVEPIEEPLDDSPTQPDREEHPSPDDPLRMPEPQPSR